MSRNGVLYARPESLRAYGIALPDAEATEAGKNGVVPEIQDDASTPGAGVWFELSTIPGLQAKYDVAAQTLDLTAPLEWQPDLKTARIGAPQENRYAIAVGHTQQLGHLGRDMMMLLPCTARSLIS